MILTPLQKLPKNVGDLGKIIVATGFEWFSKVQKIAQSGHTAQILLPTTIGRPLVGWLEGGSISNGQCGWSEN